MVDPKLEEFVKDLAENPILKDTKKIVFTESKETASYIGERLKQIYGSRVVVFSGESTNYLKQEIEDSYNPKNKGKNNDKYDILITTDVLAEGINLHRANVLINYDLPWNPTRIMQRVGRINRVGTEFDRIYVFNFFPTSQANAQLPLKDRILEKLQAFHDILGEDFKYLSEDEQVSSHKLYENLTGSLDGEEENVNPELEYLTLIRNIRDDNIELFEKIKKLPLKCKSGKNSTLISGNGTISFIRKGALKTFFKTVSDSTQELTFIEAIQYIKCPVDEPKIAIKDIYFDQLATNKDAFNNKLLQEELEITEGRTISGNDKKILTYLKALLSCRKFTESEESTIEKIKMMLEYGELPQATSKQIVANLKNVEDPIQIFHVILDEIPAKYFDGRKTKKIERKGKKQVILSCYLEG
jgi:superfamily II DNA/RNA helicase